MATTTTNATTPITAAKTNATSMAIAMRRTTTTTTTGAAAPVAFSGRVLADAKKGPVRAVGRAAAYLTIKHVCRSGHNTSRRRTSSTQAVAWICRMIS